MKIKVCEECKSDLNYNEKTCIGCELLKDEIYMDVFMKSIRADSYRKDTLVISLNELSEILRSHFDNEVLPIKEKK